MLKVAILDDEKSFCELLAEKLSPILADLHEKYQIACYTNVAKLEKAASDFDLIFLDIRMPGENGVELAKKLRADGNYSALVFMTAFREYAIDAFEVEAVDYLCKPVDSFRLKQAVNRVLAKRRRPVERTLAIQTLSLRRYVKFNTIYFCEVINRKIYLHTTDEVVGYYGKMEELEAQLDGRFFRCHRSYIVNLEHLKSYANGQAVLENGDCVPVSRLRHKELLEVMLRYLKGMAPL